MADFLETKSKLTHAFLVGVQMADMPEGEGDELLAELAELVGNLRLEIVRKTLVRLRRVSPSLLIGSGKAAEIAELAKADGADVIVFDAALSPAQQRNWEELAGTCGDRPPGSDSRGVRGPGAHPRGGPPGGPCADGILPSPAHPGVDPPVPPARAAAPWAARARPSSSRTGVSSAPA